MTGGEWRIGENVPWTSAWTSEIAFEFRPSTDFPGLTDVVQRESQGVGAPLFAGMHITRHRRAMFRHLCHVCGRPTVRGDRYLFPLQSGGMVDMGDGTRRYGGNVPPVHRTCGVKARKLCPHLSRSVGDPVPFPKDEGRIVQRTDVQPGMEALAGTVPPGLEVVYSCYRLHEAPFTRLVEKLQAQAAR